MEKLNFKSMIIVFGIFVSAVIVISAPKGEEGFWNSIALGGLMIFFWIFEVIPIYVTALFPFVLAAPLGVMETSDLAASYGNSNVFLFFGGFVLSLALEKWDVHKQIAQAIIRFVGTSKARILFGFLISTGLLSMWISNTATALMMLPMALGVTENLPIDKKSKFPIFLLLAVAYGSSLGGMATLVGSPPNTQMAAILSESYHVEIGFFEWMKIGLPLSLILILATYGLFLLLMGNERKSTIEGFEMEKKPWTSDQKKVVFLFLGVVILWSFRAPLTQWTGFEYRDEGAAVLGAILLFFIPSSHKGKSLLEWNDTKNLPWGILLLFGGGLALANMFEANGVIDAMTTIFDKFSGMDISILLLILISIAIFATEIMSNLALVTVFIPVVAAFALKSDYSIIQLCVPVTMAASCAFMLPVGTPPNAIVFSTGQLKISQMAKIGFVLNIAAILIVVAFSLAVFS